MRSENEPAPDEVTTASSVYFPNSLNRVSHVSAPSAFALLDEVHLRKVRLVLAVLQAGDSGPGIVFNRDSSLQKMRAAVHRTFRPHHGPMGEQHDQKEDDGDRPD